MSALPSGAATPSSTPRTARVGRRGLDGARPSDRAHATPGAVPYEGLFGGDDNRKYSAEASARVATATAGRSVALQSGGERSRSLAAYGATADKDRQRSLGSLAQRGAVPTAAASNDPASKKRSQSSILSWVFWLGSLAVVAAGVAAAVELEKTHALISSQLAALGLVPAKPLTPSQLQYAVEDLQKKQKSLASNLQVQMEMLSKKLEETKTDQVELRETVEKQHNEVKTELQQLASKIADMDASLADLYSTSSPVMQKHMLAIVEKVTEAREVAGPPMTLDDVRQAAREVVEAEIETHAADGIGRGDFALGSMGSKVVRHSSALARPGFFNPLLPLARSVLRLPDLHAQAQEVIHPHFGTAGSCLPLAGSSGFVEIQFQRAVDITSVSMEHIHKSVALDLSTAPREFRVFGAKDPLLLHSTWFPTATPSAHHLEKLSWQWLGDAVYSTDGPSVQTFSVSAPLPQPDPDAPMTKSKKKAKTLEESGAGFNFVRFVFLSNHGHPNYTCIYRLRVHGNAAGSIQASQSLEPAVGSE